MMFELYYSLFGIVGVTDESLEALAKTCSGTLKTLDVNGCINIQVLVYSTTLCDIFIIGVILLAQYLNDPFGTQLYMEVMEMIHNLKFYKLLSLL